MPRGSAGPRPCRFALLAALPWEVRPFLRHVKARRRRDLGLRAWEFVLGRERGLLALSGLGQEAAREALRRLLLQERPEILISLGFGGALTPELTPGTLVLGASFWTYDPDGARLSPAPAPAPPRPLAELLGCLAGAGLPAFSGSVVSSPVILPKERLGDRLRGLRLPVLDLETAALAREAGTKGLPFLALRAITDAAGEEIPEFISRAGGNLGVRAALGWLAADPRRLRPLLHLWGRSQLAASRLARALVVLLPSLPAPGEEFQSQPAQEG